MGLGLLDWRNAEHLAFFGLVGTAFGIAFSIALGQVLAGLCFLCAAMGLARGKIVPRWTMEATLAAVFGLLAVWSVRVGVDPHHWWAKTGELLWLAFIPVTAMLVRDAGRARVLIAAFIAGCAVQGAETAVRNPLGAWRKPVPDFMTALVDRGSMTDGQMLMLGACITLAWLVLSRGATRRARGWLLVALTLQTAGLLLNFKRGSWFCATLLVAAVVLAHARWRMWLACVAVLALLVALPPVRARLGQLGHEFDPKSGGRLAMWTRVTPTLVREYPQGVGYGALTGELMRKAYARVEPNRNHVHANWAQVLVETGWAGFTVYGVWMAWLLGAAIRGTRAGLSPGPEQGPVALSALLVVGGLLLNGLVEYNLGDAELLIVLALFAGLVAGLRSAVPGATAASAGNTPV